jgi:transposase
LPGILPGMRTAYQTDLSDAEWVLIQPHLPAPRAPGRPRVHPLREILDAVFFYVVRGGCTWRLLPHDSPPWKTVYHYFRLWRIDGTWERLHEALRRRARVHLGRDPQPSAGIVDSQSVKRPPGWAAKNVATMLVRRSREESATCLWTAKGWCSKRRSTRPTSSTLRRHKAAYGTRRGEVPAPFASVARCRLQRQGKGQRLG